MCQVPEKLNKTSLTKRGRIAQTSLARPSTQSSTPDARTLAPRCGPTCGRRPFDKRSRPWRSHEGLPKALCGLVDLACFPKRLRLGCWARSPLGHRGIDEQVARIGSRRPESKASCSAHALKKPVCWARCPDEYRYVLKARACQQHLQHMSIIGQHWHRSPTRLLLAGSPKGRRTYTNKSCV